MASKDFPRPGPMLCFAALGSQLRSIRLRWRSASTGQTQCMPCICVALLTAI